MSFFAEICIRTLLGKLSARRSYVAEASNLVIFQLSKVDARLSSFSLLLFFDTTRFIPG